MNKRPILFIVGIVTVVTAGLASLPLIDGYIYKNKFINVVTHAHQATMNNSLKLEVQEYNLGWLHSTVKLRLVSTDPELNKHYADGIIIDGVVSHGPFVYDTAKQRYVFAYANIVSKMYLPQNMQKIILPNSPNQSLVEFQTLTTFDGVWSQVVTISPLKFPGVGILKFNEINGKSSFGISGDSLSSVSSITNIGVMSFKGDNENPSVPSIDIQSSQYKLDATKQTNNIWNSMTSGVIPGVTVNWPVGKVASAKNITASSKRGMNATNLYGFDLKFMIAELNIPDVTLSSISKVDFSFEIMNLNPTAIANYMDYLSFENKELMSSKNMAQTQKIWQDMLTPTSKINLNLSFDSPSGALSIVSTAFINTTTDIKDMQLPDLMTKAKMEAKMTIAGSLLSLLTQKGIEEMDARNKRLQSIAKNSALLASGTSVTDDNAINPLQEQISEQLRQGKITLDQSLAILTLSEQSLPTDEFYKKVNAISPDSSMLITQTYQKMMVEKKNTDSSSPGLIQKTSPSPVETVEDRSKAMIDTWVQQGYLVKQEGDYVANVVIAESELKINGHDFPSKQGAIVPTPSVVVPQ